MIDREKVIVGLKCCKWSRQNVKPEKNKCDECPYKDQDIMNAFAVWRSCTNVLAIDALSLLKEQEEQIKNRDESLEKAREEIKWLRGMLKEQEPVKVKDYADIVDGIQVGYCPKCDRKIVWNPEKEDTVAFCKYCGKRVKWNA